MKPLSLLASLLLLVPAALFAQDWRAPESGGPHTATSLSHAGSSPFDPRPEDDTRFVVDSGSGLDTGCTFRDGGPLVIHLQIKRYVGPTKGDSTLADPAGLVSKGLVSAKAHIRMPAYDVDVNGAPGYPPEVDNVSFNGHALGSLTGDNNIWKLNEFDVPIDWVKFPSKGSPGTPPAPADNIIQIDIDQASIPYFNWCTSIDWVELEFQAVAPIFLVHGTNANSGSWDPNFTAFFGNSGAPWSNDINLTPNGTIVGNGAQLATRVQQLAAMFGAKKCHIIAHSKGGLDTRAYLNNQYDAKKVKVLSVYTLSTPHHGTIISDITVAARTTTHPESPNPDIQTLISLDGWTPSSSTPQPPALNDQTTVHMAQFNSQYPSVPGGIKFYNYGADADLNHNGHIEAGETAPLLPGWLPNSLLASAGTAMYRAIGNVGSIRVVTGTRYFGLRTFTSIEVASTNHPFALNDLVVSVASAHSPFGTFLQQLNANHSSMKTTALASTILQRILSDFPNH